MEDKLLSLLSKWRATKPKRRRKPQKPVDSRRATFESLENRELLSADPSYICDVDIADFACALVAPSNADDEIFVLETTSTESQYSLAPPTTIAIQDVEFNEIAQTDACWDDELETLPGADSGANEDVDSFVVDGKTYVRYEDLAIFQLTRQDNESDQMDNLESSEDAILPPARSQGDGEGDSPNSGGSGGASPIPYVLIVSSTCNSSIISLTSAGLTNPLLERRELAPTGESFQARTANSDYVAVSLPALPYGYVGTVVVAGNLNAYELYLDPNSTQSIVTDSIHSTRSFDYSGGSTGFYLFPRNDAAFENNMIISAAMTAHLPESGGTDAITTYDFTYIGQPVLATIVDDDQWLITADVDKADAYEGNPNVADCVVEDGKFNVKRTFNTTATYYHNLCANYTLDDTYPIQVEIGGAGSATYAVDYEYRLEESSTSISAVTIPASTLFVPVRVVPIEDYVFEQNETVQMTFDFADNWLEYDVATSTNAVTIYQAPEFITGNDYGVVDSDVKNLGFIYGKPRVSNSVVSLNAIGNGSIRFVIDETAQDQSLYFNVVGNTVVWSLLPQATYYQYSFTFTVLVYDETKPQKLFDRVTVSVTYGWAALTLCVIQPNANNPNVLFTASKHGGHAFWIIEATSSLTEYCNTNYSANNSINNMYSYIQLRNNVNAFLGYHPQTSSLHLLENDDDGILGWDADDASQATVHSSYLISSLDYYLNALIEVKTIETDTTDRYRLMDMNGQTAHNCVDVAIEVAASIGVNLTVTRISNYEFYAPDPDHLYLPKLYVFNGYAPAKFGADLKDFSNGVSGAYFAGTTMRWDWDWD